MGVALEKHGEFSKQKKSCCFRKCHKLVTVGFFNPFSPSCLFTNLPGAPSTSKVGAVHRKDVFYYRLYIREQHHSKLTLTHGELIEKYTSIFNQTL